MAHQTEYPNQMATGYPGMLSDTGHYDNDSMTVTVGDVAFGAPVAYGTVDRTCRPVAAGDTRIAGIAIRVQGGSASGNNGLTGTDVNRFKVGDTASIMKKGRIFVTTPAAVVAGEPCFVVLADGTFANAGDIEVGVFQTGAAAGGLARVRIK